MTISDALFNTFDDTVTDMLNSNMAPTCILVYPPSQEECPNCIVNPFSGSSGKYKSGGPVSFSDGQICPYCQGLGVINTESTANIKLLIDWNPRSYNNVSFSANNSNASRIAVADGNIMVQGFISDLQKFRQAIQIKVHSNLGNFDYWIYEKSGEPIPYGLSHNTFFGCLLKRVG